MMPTQVLHLKLTHQAHMAQHRSHLAPALLLIYLGVQELWSGEREHLWLNLLGIALGLALVIAFKREAARKGEHRHARVAWYDVIAGSVIILEGVHKLHGHKWWQPGTLTMAVGTATMIIGFQHHSLPKLRRLRCTDEGFSLRIRPISWLVMPWRKVESVELKGNRLMVHDTGGHLHSRSLRRIENRAEVAEMLQEHLARHKEMAVVG